MTLRDLTKRQLYNLRRRCEKQRRVWWQGGYKNVPTIFDAHRQSWNAAFNAGLKAGLELRKDV